MLRRWWNEPLLHFIAIGAALFLVFAWRGGAASSTRIVITPGQIDALAAAYERTWQRPPTEEELKAQIDEYVREEIATREATAMGLDRDDTIVRRRLRQKFEFLAEDTIDEAPVSDAELQAWLDAHPEMYAADPEFSFRHVFLSPDRQSAAEDAARSLRDELTRRGVDAPIDSVGDRIMLAPEFERATRTDVARQFGDEFADALLTIETARWVAPIRSGYGVHVVLLRARQPGRLPSLADIRPQVERDFRAERRRRRLQSIYDDLLGRYRVVIDRRETPAGGGGTAARSGEEP